MTSVGHRKNFMKAITNLKMIFHGTSGKNSDYIKQKIQKFYERNKQKNAKTGLFNSLGSTEGQGQGRFYSQNFFTKNLFQSNNQIIEEDDEHSIKFDTNHSPNMGPKSENENNIQSLALSGDRKLSHNHESGSEGGNKTQEFEDDEEIMQARPKVLQKEDSKGSSRDNENNQTNKSPPIEGKGSYKQNVDQKLTRMATEGKIGSPNKKFESSEKQDIMDEVEDAKMEANGQHSSKHEKASPVNLHDLSSSDTSSSSSSSEDERSKKAADEKAKEEALAQSNIVQKIVRADSKVEKKVHKKTTSLGVNNFRSAEFVKSKSSQYREDGKRRKNNHNRKKGGTQLLLARY